MTDVTEDGVAAPDEYMEMAMAAMINLAAPQQTYLDLIAAGGFAQPMEGVALSYSRANTEYVLRHYEQFSSGVDLGLGNVPPVIPPTVDPPMHASDRNPPPPLSAPTRMSPQATSPPHL